jgi:hypothetical protein
MEVEVFFKGVFVPLDGTCKHDHHLGQWPKEMVIGAE